MTEQKTTGLDFEVLKRAVEDLDAELLLSFYAKDAEARFVGPGALPSSPLVWRGKQEISETFHRAYGREMTQRVEDDVMGEGRLALTVTSEFPDGKRQVCASTIELNEGGRSLGT
jgi:hypothetical protein